MEIRSLYQAIIEIEILDFSTSITILIFNLMGEVVALGDFSH